MRQEDFDQQFNYIYEERSPNYDGSVNIAIIGKVSTGKSSLLNALLKRKKEDAISDVGAISGVTTSIKTYKLSDHVLIIDSPGLDDIKEENTKTTKDFLKNIDIGILVLTGSADATQKKHLADLRKTCSSTFVALNKWDMYDKYNTKAQSAIIDQWKNTLKQGKIYKTVCIGYDSDMDGELDIRGVDELREDLYVELERKKKEIHLQSVMGDKRTYAIGIITTALIAVGTEAFIPGSAIYISSTQAIAIGALYYLYTGKVLSKTASIALLPTFAAQSIGTSLFLFAKSFLPPTGVVDAAAAGVAVLVTAAMLITINKIISSGHELSEKERIKTEYNKTKKAITKHLAGSTPRDWGSKDFWTKTIQSFLF